MEILIFDVFLTFFYSCFVAFNFLALETIDKDKLNFNFAFRHMHNILTSLFFFTITHLLNTSFYFFIFPLLFFLFSKVHLLLSISLLYNNFIKIQSQGFSRVKVQGEQDDFRTFRWLYEIDSLDDVLEESRYLLKI